MARQHPPLIELVPWTEQDISLLQRLNEPVMTEHLGGPEPQSQLQARLRRYAAQSEQTQMFKVLEDGMPAGGVGFWEREWGGETVYETGWSTLPEFQGRGVASKAMELLIGIVQKARRHRTMHAFPSVDNGPSNAVCRKLGFELVGETDFEYPKGHSMRCNDWRLAIAE